MWIAEEINNAVARVWRFHLAAPIAYDALDALDAPGAPPAVSDLGVAAGFEGAAADQADNNAGNRSVAVVHARPFVLVWPAYTCPRVDVHVCVFLLVCRHTRLRMWHIAHTHAHHSQGHG